MKVAIVCPYAFDAPGGVQDQAARLVQWLRADGDEAWAVAPGSGGPPGTRHVGRFVSWSANRSKAPIALNPFVARRVAAAIEDADVVHVHEPLMPMVSLSAVLAKGPPKVGTFHADPGRIARTLYRRAGWLLTRIFNRLAVSTAVSDVAAGALAGAVRPTIVPNGIDLDAFGPDDKVSGRCLFVGRDDPRKGLAVLLEAWPAVAAELRHATLDVLGVDRAARRRVRFRGRVSEEEKVAALGAAEVLVAPNLGGESFGIVVLEGLASGCAVVASDLEAFRGVAGEAASYFPTGDSDALSGALVGLLTEPGRLTDLAAAGQRRAERFGRENVMRGYLDAYEQALAPA